MRFPKFPPLVLVVMLMLFHLQENHRLGGNFAWPSVSVVMEYRNKVRQVVLNVIDTAPFQLPITVDNPMVRSNTDIELIRNVTFL